MKYKVGDKVRVRKDLKEKNYYMEDKTEWWPAVDGMIAFRNKIVTIIMASPLGYKILECSGWWTDEMFVDIADKKKIVITFDGAETLARLYEGNKVVKSATAKCSPEDEFDFNTGARLAFDRLFETAAEKKEEYYNGKVVCVKNGIIGFTVGKIYTFVDGETKDNKGVARPMHRRIKKLEEYSGFIPYVE